MHTVSPDPSARRSFLGRLGAGVVALAAGTPALARASTAAPSPGSAADDAWLGKIKGKHRQVFDAVSAGEQNGLLFARNFLVSHKEAGSKDGDTTAVVVLRHWAIPYVFTDAMWAKYKLGEGFKVNDPATKAPSVRNFAMNSKPGDLLLPDMSIDQLLAKNVVIVGCNMAAQYTAMVTAQATGGKMEDVYKDLVANLIPGITLAASGVYAVNRAQETGCSYCYAG